MTANNVFLVSVTFSFDSSNFGFQTTLTEPAELYQIKESRTYQVRCLKCIKKMITSANLSKLKITGVEKIKCLGIINDVF